MLTAVLTLVVSAPFAPQLYGPGNGDWVNGNALWLMLSHFEDDAGVAEGDVRLEFRNADAGYGLVNEQRPWAEGLSPQHTFPVDGETWCWHVIAINALGEASAPSPEFCFHVDNTRPSLAAHPTVTTVVSNGQVTVPFTAGADTVSGVRGVFLETATSLTGNTYDFLLPLSSASPLVTFLGEGTWFGWLTTTDFAGNERRDDTNVITLVITADNTKAALAAPTWVDTVNSQYGNVLEWDAGTASGVVVSFCDIDAGCVWRHANQNESSVRTQAWVQTGFEGWAIARVAGIYGTSVGPWSAPSAPFLADRTPPSTPLNVMANPVASRQATTNVTWSPSVDDRSGVGGYQVDVLEVSSMNTVSHFSALESVLAPVTTEGRYQLTVTAFDDAGNFGTASSSVDFLYDSTGPDSAPPVAAALISDGGPNAALTWSAPVDRYSVLDHLELRESGSDGGTSVFTVTGTSTSRTVSVGSWTWALRGVDALGNVGAWSGESNVITVDALGGVDAGPVMDAGVGALDAGADQPDAGADQPHRDLAVGCGCASVEGLLWGVALLLLRRRRAL